MKIMEKMQLLMVALVVICLMAFESRAQERGLNGLIIGAGSGAVVGQAIGRDAKATLIGSAVGGMVGLMVGNEMDRAEYSREYDATQAAVFIPPPPPLPSIVFSYNDRDRDRGDHRRHEYSRSHRPSQVCWEEVVRVERHHGRYREITKTVCRDRDWRRHEHDHWRDNRWRDRW